MIVCDIIENVSDKKLAEKIVNSYQEVEENVFLEKWKPSKVANES